MTFPFSLSPLWKEGSLGTFSIYLLQHLASISAGPPGVLPWLVVWHPGSGRVWLVLQTTHPTCLGGEGDGAAHKTMLTPPGNIQGPPSPSISTAPGVSSHCPKRKVSSNQPLPFSLICFPGWQLTQLPASKPGQAGRGRVKAPYLLQHFLFPGSLRNDITSQLGH